MSTHSTGVVRDDEQLARFVFSPLHVRKNGTLKPSLFSHVANQGCSIQRDSCATNLELSLFLENFLADPRWTWHGVLMATCGDVRSIKMDNWPTNRAICIYDTSEENNPSHAEMFQSHFEVDNGDPNELRALLLNAFSKGIPILPNTYRNGSLASVITEDSLDDDSE